MFIYCTVQYSCTITQYYNCQLGLIVLVLAVVFTLPRRNLHLHYICKTYSFMITINSAYWCIACSGYNAGQASVRVRSGFRIPWCRFGPYIGTSYANPDPAKLLHCYSWPISSHNNTYIFQGSNSSPGI